MSTTTIRLPEALKSRIANLAAQAGTSTHNLILEAIAEKTEQLERQNDFHATAESRYENILATGETIAWSEMRQYLESRAKGLPASPPTPGKLSD
ncbi:MAG: CopG family transcriptional regulator [Betaproteobacteria bacterium HGW-Betaproteobacteria-10]|jgi:predicted transcriptional regulator|nr:MAG: CopG family transcriptional regulator [Betaproteobacteria bacterium HGW-Betaproteobacteria-10]